MLLCLWLPAALAVALAGANEDIGVEKGGRGVTSKPASLFITGYQHPPAVIPAGRSQVARSELRTSPALMLDTSGYAFGITSIRSAITFSSV